MTANFRTSGSRKATGAGPQHDCADHGCLAAMLGLESGDTSVGDSEEF